MPHPHSEPDYDRQQAGVPDGPTCSRCGKRAELACPPDPATCIPQLYACSTDGEFYLDREGWSTRQVFLDDSAPTVAVPVEVAVLDGDEEGDIAF